MGLPPLPAFVSLASSQETPLRPKRKEKGKESRVTNYGMIDPTAGEKGKVIQEQ